MSDLELIVNKIKQVADKNGYDVKPNIEKIAKAKLMFFGVDNWQRCPCYPKEDTTHGCDTPQCNLEINKCGICHCNLYELKEV